MADEIRKLVLRKSLDAVDRGRRWAMLGDRRRVVAARALRVLDTAHRVARAYSAP